MVRTRWREGSDLNHALTRVNCYSVDCFLMRLVAGAESDIDMFHSCLVLPNA